MGKHFGNLQKLKGVVYYSLSPMELNPFMMMINPGIKNMVQRFFYALGPAILPLSGTYLVYDWGMTTYHQQHRKNPEDFKNDV